MNGRQAPHGEPVQLSEADIKRIQREMVKLWHPDRAIVELRLASKPDGVLKTVNNLFDDIEKEGLRTFEKWPSTFRDDTQVTFPGFLHDDPDKQPTESKTIYIPRTPNEFFTLLRYVASNRALPNREFPKVRINRATTREDEDGIDREDARGYMDEVFDNAFDAYCASLKTNSKLDELIHKVKGLEVLPPGYAEEYGLHDIVDGQGEYLINSAFITADSKEEFSDILTKLAKFPFSEKAKEAELDKKLMEIGAEYAKRFFLEKMKRASSVSGLDKLEADIEDFYTKHSFAEKDKPELLEWVGKKRTSYREIWAKRQAERGVSEGE